jgi:hypothetical protein
MATVPTSPLDDAFQGPIALEHALFCLDCEVIFTSLACCPSCSSRILWPLAKWLSPTPPALIAESASAGCFLISDGGADNCRAVA